MSTVVELPVDVTGPLPLGESADDERGAPIFLNRPTTARGEEGLGRDVVGVARTRSTPAGLVIAAEVDAATAEALRFGSVRIADIEVDGGDVVEGALDGWRLTAATVERRYVAAAVHRAGWDDLPIADRERSWDGEAAAQRIASACAVDRAGVDSSPADWECYASAHLYRDDEANPDTRGAYKMLIVDEVDGRRTIIPRAVFAAAAALQGARGGIDADASAIAAMRSVVSGLYRRMADAWDDESVRAPWDREDD